MQQGRVSQPAAYHPNGREVSAFWQSCVSFKERFLLCSDPPTRLRVQLPDFGLKVAEFGAVQFHFELSQPLVARLYARC